LMVYAVQNYKAYFGFYPSSGIYKVKNHNVSETGSVSILRWMGQDRPTHRTIQWLRLALSNGPNWVGLSCPIHLRTETSSLQNIVVFCLIYTRRWIKSKISLIVLYSLHHRQNPFEWICIHYFSESVNDVNITDINWTILYNLVWTSPLMSKWRQNVVLR
jgi:hypothetical protein